MPFRSTNFITLHGLIYIYLWTFLTLSNSYVFYYIDTSRLSWESIPENLRKKNSLFTNLKKKSQFTSLTIFNKIFVLFCFTLTQWKSGTNNGITWMGLNLYDYHLFQLKRWYAYTYAKQCNSKQQLCVLLSILVHLKSTESRDKM